MSDQEPATDFDEPTFYVLLGTLLGSVIAGVSWCAKKHCQRTNCKINSGCCQFDSSSERLRRTIREEIRAERIQRESSSNLDESPHGDLEQQKPRDTD